jgi:hypothetical protein
MTDAHDATRRKLVIAASAAGAGLLLTAGNAGLVLAAQKGHGKGQEKEVGAVEDLMREHGVLRRALLVYSESVPKIRANLGALLLGLPALAAASSSHILELISSFYRSGALVFGGGHVVLPLLQQAVVPPGWVSNDAFLAGYGANNAINPFRRVRALAGDHPAAALGRKPKRVSQRLRAMHSISTPLPLLS